MMILQANLRVNPHTYIYKDNSWQSFCDVKQFQTQPNYWKKICQFATQSNERIVQTTMWSTFPRMTMNCY